MNLLWGISIYNFKTVPTMFDDGRIIGVTPITNCAVMHVVVIQCKSPSMEYIEDIQFFSLNMSFISRVKCKIFIFHT